MSPEVIIVAKGQLSHEEIEHNLRFLAAQGLKTEIVDSKAYRDLREGLAIRRPEICSVDEINSGEQFLVREHFSEFRINYRADLPTTTSGIAFGVVTHPKRILPKISRYYDPSRSRRYRPRDIRPEESIDPDSLGLVVHRRDEVGLPIPENLPRGTNVAAVQVGSLLEFIRDVLPDQKSSINGLTDKTEKFLVALAQHLEERIRISESAL